MHINAWKVGIILSIIMQCLATPAAAGNGYVKDTIIVSLDETYGKFVLHQVQKKQTLYSLSNAYGIDLYDIYDYNPVLKSRVLGVNDIIRVPLATDHIITNEVDLVTDQSYSQMYYIIQPKDNLYRIAKVYFNMSFEDLMKRNQLASHTIKVGQKLLIGWYDPLKKSQGAPDFKQDIVKNEQHTLEQKWSESNPNTFTEEYKAISPPSDKWVSKYSEKENSADRLIPLTEDLAEINIKDRIDTKSEAATDNSKMENTSRANEIKSTGALYRPEKSKVLKRRMITSNGIAQWSKSNSTSTDLYVLHPTAPVNSIVELTNPMTHRKIYAKVLSNMPPKLYAEDVSVVVSPGVANLLGAIDGKFYVKLRFVEETIQ
ncbi:MAG: LysM peptidoglycan-binding domain-containing protein [Saprospiraceae bacterium]|nr:LysM peptidoglycan-binding domain-containing protein [Saprospiraceae bacterium]